ncbi:MAG: DUF4347 domain-containing protein, partial [Pseudomonadota bacterium]
EVFLYSCNVAAGDAGEEFLLKLRSLTSAEVYASITKVGHADAGGNWLLDVVASPYQSGLLPVQVSAEQLLSEEAIANFSGVLVPDGGGFESVPSATPSTSEPTTAQRSLVILDAGVEDQASLIADFEQRGVEYVMLNSDADGIEQITEILSNYSDLDALHIISHGGQGQAFLGNATLSEETVSEYQTELVNWGSALGENGDILFYGCDLAQGTEGVSLITEISDLTGADIAASDDLTGAARLGGDWDLEVASGQIEAQAVEVTDWKGVLTETAPANSFATLLSGGSIVVDGVTVTATTTGTVNSFGGDTQLDPGAHINPGFGNSTSSLTLNFSSPITQFTTTFEAQQDEEQITFDQPATSIVNNFNSTYGVATPILSQATLENGNLQLRSNLTAPTNANNSQSFGSNSEVTWVFVTPVTSLTITHTGVDSPLTTQPLVAENTNYNGTIIGGAFALTAQPATPNTAPIVDLNTDATVADTNRDNAVTFTAGGSAVDVTDAAAGTFDADGDNYQALTIALGGVTDGAAEQVTIAGQTFALDGATNIQAATISGASIELSYIDGSFTVREASDAALTEAQIEAIVRSVQYDNTSATPTAGNRTLDFQVQQADGSFVIDFEEFTVPSAPGATALESSPYWGDSAFNNGGINSGSNEPGFALATNADGN